MVIRVKNIVREILTLSLSFNLYSIICTTGKVPRILLHIGRTSSENSAINAIWGGRWENAIPNFKICPKLTEKSSVTTDLGLNTPVSEELPAKLTLASI